MAEKPSVMDQPTLPEGNEPAPIASYTRASGVSAGMAGGAGRRRSQQHRAASCRAVPLACVTANNRQSNRRCWLWESCMSLIMSKSDCHKAVPASTAWGRGTLPAVSQDHCGRHKSLLARLDIEWRSAEELNGT